MFSWLNTKFISEKSSQQKSLSKKDRNLIVKAMGIITAQGAGRGQFEEPEYSLEEIKRAADADSYIKIALMKYSYLIYKAGYILKSDNDEATEYIKTRFKIMSFSTKTPMDVLFEGISDDMVKYSNAFLLKSRVDEIGYGIKAIGIEVDKRPVGGYFRADPSSIGIKRDKHGTIIKYEQRNDMGESITFAPSEVIHFYMDKDASHAYGTPRIIAALEDVKLLRRIEGNVISLIYRFAIPLYHWKIGLKEAGSQGSEAEISEAKREVENMALDGIVFTNERNEIKAIGAEGNALDATGYLAYFEKRALAALDISQSQIGRGGQKDADSVEGQVHDVVKHIQRNLKIFIENMIICELLLEGGFDPILKATDNVFYEFNELSLDTKVKLENHEMLKFQSNVHTFEEARTNMGLENEVDEEKLFANMITKRVTMEQQNNVTKNAIKLANVNAKNSEEASQEVKKDAKPNSGGKSGNNGSTKNTANKDVSTRNMPKNQHGTYSVKIKESAEKPVSPKKNYISIHNTYSKLRNDILEDTLSMYALIDVANRDICKTLRAELIASSNEGIEKAMSEVKTIEYKNLLKKGYIDTTEMFHEGEKLINSFFVDLIISIDSNDSNDLNLISSVFDSLEYKLNMFVEYSKRKAYIYSFAKTGENFGVDKMTITDVKKNVLIANIKTSEITKKEISELAISSDDYGISFKEVSSCQ